MLKLTIRADNLDKVAGALQRLGDGQIKQAMALALNDTGHQARRAMQAEMDRVFDRVTLWVRKSPKVFPAAPDRLQVAVAPTLTTDYGVFQRGGKVGVDPQDVLQAQVQGGARHDKKSEVALRRAGILPSGWQTSIPATPYPGSDDGRGNLRGAFMQQLLAYLQAYRAEGHSNMSDRRKRKLHNKQGIGYTGSRKVHQTTLGVRYFVSLGRERDKTRHLPPGIWAAKGLHDVEIKPVLMFTRKGSYKPRLDMDAVIQQADLQTYLDRRVRFRIREAAGM